MLEILQKGKIKKEIYYMIHFELSFNTNHVTIVTMMTKTYKMMMAAILD